MCWTSTKLFTLYGLTECMQPLHWRLPGDLKMAASESQGQCPRWSGKQSLIWQTRQFAFHFSSWPIFYHNQITVGYMTHTRGRADGVICLMVAGEKSVSFGASSLSPRSNEHHLVGIIIMESSFAISVGLLACPNILTPKQRQPRTRWIYYKEAAEICGINFGYQNIFWLLVILRKRKERKKRKSRSSTHFISS